jgi:uncharacterized membrane protein YdjX (TVP38/TMEM64 family)
MEFLFDRETLQEMIHGFGVWGPVVFFLLQILQAIIAPIPGNLLTMAGGALFGIWPGFLLAYAGNVIGSVIGFSIVRKFGKPLLIKLIGSKRYGRVMGMIGTHSALARTKILLILVVLLPFLPSDFMCLVAGLTPIPFRTFFIIVLTCRPWGQFAAAALGDYSFVLPPALLIVILSVILAVCAAAVRFAPKIESFTMALVRRLAKFFK